MGLIDSHAHLTFPELRDRLDEILTRCDVTGIDRIITLGIDLDDTSSAVQFARLHPDRIHAAGAFHPHEAEKVTDDLLTAMAELWDDPSVVALGEMGLDYHHNFAAQETQRSIFARQLELAVIRSKPLIIHCREAFVDVVPMLVEHGFEGRPVVFHCFTGSTAEALRLQERGWRISFTGVVTFTKSTELQHIAKSYPYEALMIETDSPYLSPVPVRGKQPNEPAHLMYTARFLADLRGVTYEELAQQTARNTMRFFNL